MASIPGPLTLATSSTLMADPTYRGRVKVALLTLAEVITTEAATTAGHVSRFALAQRIFQQPDVLALEVGQIAALDTNIQANGSNATDAQIQAAVVNAVAQII